MLNRLLLAAAITFSLNVFLGVCVSSTPQTASELNQQQTPSQTGKLLRERNSLQQVPVAYRTQP